MARKYSSFLVFVLMAAVLPALEFEFQYEAGDKYRIVSWVEEDVYVNGVYNHSAQVYNRIAMEITETDGDRGFHKGTFVTSLRDMVGDTPLLDWSEEYYSEFWRDGHGLYEITDAYFMPIVRNVPVFPDRDLEIGEEWIHRGEEVHDLREGYGIMDAYRFPIDVRYRYEGPIDYEGENYEAITVDYTVYFRPNRRYPDANYYPVRITGYSSQILYWNPREGRIEFYQEEFDFAFALSNGNEYEYRGIAGARIVEAVSMDREAVAEEVENRIGDLADTEVRVDDRGVTITLDNIQFLPESAELLPSEAAKIERIAEILADYADRDLLVTGHTALAGTAEGRRLLSTARARAVAAYLLSLGGFSPEQIMIAGKGATEPVADNDSAAGRRKNRRVEITILEN